MIDFRSRAFLNDPYPYYRRLREADAPCWMPHEQRLGTPGVWLFSSYRDAVEVFRGSGSVSKRVIQHNPPAEQILLNENMLNRDPPAHTRLRNTVAQYFTTKRVREYEPAIKRLTNRLIRQLHKGGETDFIDKFATRLPLLLMAEILGVPEGDLDKIRAWSITLGFGFDSAFSDAAVIQQQQSTLQDFYSYLVYLVEKRRSQPGDDLISALISVHGDEGELSYNELLAMCFLLLFAGHETTINLFGNGLLCLLRHPEQLALLRRDPEYLPSAIEEMLRFESPVQRSTFRITTDECEIGGQKIRKGEQVCAVIGAANRDPEQFPEPDKFDIRRMPNRHLTFGLGIHTCLGVNLARLEARIGFSEILENVADIQLADDEPDWRPNTFFRGLRSLPVYVSLAGHRSRVNRHSHLELRD